MSRVLVLGASGFLGRHVSDALKRSAAGAEVVAVERPEVAGEGVIGFDVSAEPPEAFATLLADARVSAIINCAGMTAGPPSLQVTANVLLVAKVIEAVQTLRRPMRLVHLGSAAEYGPSADRTPVAEGIAARPVSAYGALKLAATQLVALARARGDLDGVVLRVFNPLGAGMPPTSMAGRAAREMRALVGSGERTLRMGWLGAELDWVDARDVGDAVAQAAITDAPLEPILNVGSGRAVAARTLVETLAAVAGYDGEILEDAEGSNRAGGITWQAADVTLSGRVLGWRAERSMRESLEELWTSVPAAA